MSDVAWAAERLDIALQATSDGIFEVDLEGPPGRVWVSGRMAQLYGLPGFPHGGDATIEQLTAGMAPDARAMHDAAFEALVRFDMPFDVTETRTMPDGAVRTVRTRALLVRDADGRPRRLVGAVTDVTQQHAAAAALRDSEARLRQAQKMDALGTLAGGVAHDFNNLLAVILGYAEIGLVATGGEGTAGRALREIATAGRRARELVRQILTFSRRADGTSARTPVAVGEVVRETVALLKATLPRTVRVTVRIARGVGHVLGDATELQQVLVNLATNAEQAMRARGGGALRVEVLPTTLEAPLPVGARTLPVGRYIQVLVCDTGSGIPDEAVDRIFEPFFTTKPHGEGTGLGLSVVHGIVTGMGGAVRVGATGPHGTTFEVLLPQVDAAAAPPRVRRPRGGLRSGHALVVDDEPAVGDVLAVRLRAMGWQATVASSGAAALAVLEESPTRYDVVLADLMMPGLAGDDLAEGVAARWPGLPVVLLSGNPDSLSASRVEAVGALAVLAKPVGAERLAQVLAQALRGRRGRRRGAPAR